MVAKSDDMGNRLLSGGRMNGTIANIVSMKTVNECLISLRRVEDMGESVSRSIFGPEQVTVNCEPFQMSAWDQNGSSL
jgi:hypothetical protein